MAGPHQKINPPERGQPLRADFLRQVVSAITRAVVGGKGINVRKAGDRVVIDAARQIIPRGSGAGVITADTFDELPDAGSVAEGRLARVTGDGEDEQDWMFYQGPADGGGDRAWLSFTHFN